MDVVGGNMRMRWRLLKRRIFLGYEGGEMGVLGEKGWVWEGNKDGGRI